MDGMQSSNLHLNATQRDVWLIRAALQEYLASFSHTEGAIIEEIKDLLARLPAVGDSEGATNQGPPGRNPLTL